MNSNTLVWNHDLAVGQKSTVFVTFNSKEGRNISVMRDFPDLYSKQMSDLSRSSAGALWVKPSTLGFIIAI
jgi:hypothetical protein